MVHALRILNHTKIMSQCAHLGLFLLPFPVMWLLFLSTKKQISVTSPVPTSHIKTKCSQDDINLNTPKIYFVAYIICF